MNQFKKVLVAVDFSENSEYAFNYALDLSKQFGGELTIVHVLNEPANLVGFYIPNSVVFEQLNKEVEEGASSKMENFCSANMGDFKNYKTSIVSGHPYEEIIRKANETDASLIVMGTHGRTGIEHLIFGSTAERVVRSASCPVLTIRLPVEHHKFL